MKKFYFGLLSFALMAFAGCVQDKLDNPGSTDPTVGGADEYVWLDFAVELPNDGTRSATDWTDEEDNEEDNPGHTPSDGKYDDENVKDGNEYDEDDDFEYGHDYENDVRTVLLVIADKKDGYISHAEVTGIAQAPSQGEAFQFTIKAKFKREDIDAYYKSDDFTKTVRLYAYCNYTSGIFNKFNDETTGGKALRGKTDWLHWSGSVTELPTKPGKTPTISNTIWAPRSFLMTNAKICEVFFPDNATDWNNYTNESTPFHFSGKNPELSASATDDDDDDDDDDGDDENSVQPAATKNAGKLIYVERVAARFDFRDGSPDDTDPNTYKIEGVADVLENGEVKRKTDLNLYNVQLTRMSLVNMSKGFYYLRRVSADGTETSWKVGKNETTKNYVVDTDWKAKQTIEGIVPGNVADKGADNFFNFPLYRTWATNETQDERDGVYPYNNEGWYVDNIESVLKGVDDTWKGKNTYQIWRYVTENTIPQAKSTTENPVGESSQQKTVQSVGIVFKGSILPGKDIKATYGQTVVEEQNDGTFKTVTKGRPFASDELQAALEAANKHANMKGADQKNDKVTEEYEYPALYLFEGLLYAGFDEVVKDAANDGINGSLYGAVTKVLGHWYLGKGATKFEYMATAPAAENVVTNTDPKDLADSKYIQLDIRIYNEIRNKAGHDKDSEYAGDYTTGYTIELDETSATFKKAVTQISPALNGNFTIYEASFEDPEYGGEGWGYYCYYFYWNRHNDNLKAGLMGPMEFATVRNNVYKIAVTKIGSIGHPRVPINDPNPEKPEDPDEPEVVYMDVQIEVLPWVVRVNNVEF